MNQESVFHDENIAQTSDTKTNATRMLHIHVSDVFAREITEYASKHGHEIGTVVETKCNGYDEAIGMMSRREKFLNGVIEELVEYAKETTGLVIDIDEMVARRTVRDAAEGA